MTTKAKLCSRATKGRPRLFNPNGAGYLTVLLSKDHFRFINYLAGPAPGRRAPTVRRLIDIGIAAERRARRAKRVAT